MLGRPNPKSRLVSHNCYTDRANLGSNWNYDPNGKQMGKQMKRRLAAVFNNTTQTHTAEVNKVGVFNDVIFNILLFYLLST